MGVREKGETLPDPHLENKIRSRYDTGEVHSAESAWKDTRRGGLHGEYAPNGQARPDAGTKSDRLRNNKKSKRR